MEPASMSCSTPPGLGRVGVFWDIQNCCIPHGKSATRVVDKVRSLPQCQGQSEVEFLVVCDVTRLPADIINELNLAQVSVQHVCVSKKNSADEKLRQAMRKFVDNFGRGSTMVVISGDIDFLADLSDFRRRKGVKVILLHNCMANEAMQSVADFSQDFSVLLEDIPSQGSTSSSSFQFTELEVTNLPGPQDMPKQNVEKRLEEICRFHKCKLKLFNERERVAVLKFDHGSQATKALGALKGFTMGLNEINVDYNKRGSFMGLTRAMSRTHSMSPARELKSRPIATVRGIAAQGSLPNPKQQSRTNPWEEDEGLIFRQSMADSTNFVVTRDPESNMRRVSSSVLELQNYQQRPTVANLSPRARRRVQDLQARCASPTPEAGAKKKKTRRRRTSKSAMRIERSASQTESEASEKSCDSLPDQMNDLELLNKEGVQKESPIGMKLMLQIPQREQSEVERIFSEILEVYDIEVSSQQLQKSDDGWTCTVGIRGFACAQKVIDFVDDLPPGELPLQVTFCEPVQAGQCAILRTIPNDTHLKWEELERIFLAQLNSSANVPTLEELRRVPGIQVSTRSGVTYVLKVSSEQSTPAVPPNSLCPIHDKTSNFKESYILPNVLTTLDKLKEQLTLAMKVHNNNIHHASLLYCLHATCSTENIQDLIKVVPPEQGGVPLEQLLVALGITETVVGINGTLFIRPRGKQHSLESYPDSKPPPLATLERKFLQILEKAPYHRIAWETDFVEMFFAENKVKLSEVCRSFGGISATLEKLSGTFALIGTKRNSELILSFGYQKKIFLIALRKVLAGQESFKAGLPLDPDDLGSLYEKRMKKPFQINAFGLCSVDDMLGAILKSRQNLFKLSENRLFFKDEIETFVGNSVAILLDKYGFTCSLPAFDESYTKKHGDYSIPKLCFKSIQDLCGDFRNVFEYITRQDVNIDMISVVKPLKLAYLKKILLNELEIPQNNHCIKLDQLEHMCLLNQGFHLSTAMGNLNMTGLEELVRSFGPKNILQVLDLPNRGGKHLVLKRGDWSKDFQRRVVFLLFHCPGHRLRVSLVEQLFSNTFGNYFYLGWTFVERMIQSSILHLQGQSSEQTIHLHPNAITLSQLAVLIPILGGQIHTDQVAQEFQNRFKKNLADKDSLDLNQLDRIVPGIVNNNEGYLSVDPISGNFFLGLPQPNVMSFMERVAKAEVSTSPTLRPNTPVRKEPRRSRMAATFSPM